MINKYLLLDEKISKDMIILNMSDIHSNINHLRKIKKEIKKNKPDYIFIPGDIIDSMDCHDNAETIYLLKEISKISHIYLSLGNHEMMNLFNKKGKIVYKDEYLSYFKKIKDPNITPLLDDFNYLKLDNINLYAINLPIFFYKKKERKKILLNILKNRKIEKGFNILLIHSANSLVDNNIINNETINQMSLILSGHDHGGLVLPSIQDKINNHVGLVGPYHTLFPKNVYGIYNKNNTSLLISNGVTKISKSSILGLFNNQLNKIFKPEIDLIYLKKGKHTFKLLER